MLTAVGSGVFFFFLAVKITFYFAFANNFTRHSSSVSAFRYFYLVFPHRRLLCSSHFPGDQYRNSPFHAFHFRLSLYYSAGVPGTFSQRLEAFANFVLSRILECLCVLVAF